MTMKTPDKLRYPGVRDMIAAARAQAIEECAKAEVRMKGNPGYRLSYRDGFVDGVAAKEAAIRTQGPAAMNSPTSLLSNTHPVFEDTAAMAKDDLVERTPYDAELGKITAQDHEYAFDLLHDLSMNDPQVDRERVALWLRKVRYEAVIADRKKQTTALSARDARIAEATEALRPLATIPLWRDRYPDGPDILCDERLPFTSAQVQAARRCTGVDVPALSPEGHRSRK